jgi:hypothetical protein
VAHTFTKVLSYDPTVECDVIIDNVLYASHDPTKVITAANRFRERCELVGATLGACDGPSHSTTYRGLVLDAAAKTVAAKPTWLAKLGSRLDTILTNPPTAAQLWSIGGMMAWLRGIYSAGPFDDYWAWRAIARAARNKPSTAVTLTEEMQRAFRELREWSDRTEAGALWS